MWVLCFSCTNRHKGSKPVWKQSLSIPSTKAVPSTYAVGTPRLYTERACQTYLQITASRWISGPCTSAICLSVRLPTCLPGYTDDRRVAKAQREVTGLWGSQGGLQHSTEKQACPARRREQFAEGTASANLLRNRCPEVCRPCYVIWL